jgi:hypothetical protein
MKLTDFITEITTNTPNINQNNKPIAYIPQANIAQEVKKKYLDWSEKVDLLIDAKEKEVMSRVKGSDTDYLRYLQSMGIANPDDLEKIRTDIKMMANYYNEKIPSKDLVKRFNKWSKSKSELKANPFLEPKVNK